MNNLINGNKFEKGERVLFKGKECGVVSVTQSFSFSEDVYHYDLKCIFEDSFFYNIDECKIHSPITEEIASDEKGSEDIKMSHYKDSEIWLNEKVLYMTNDKWKYGYALERSDERKEYHILDELTGVKMWVHPNLVKPASVENEMIYTDEKDAIKPEHYKIGEFTAYKVIQAISSIYPAGLGFYVGNIIKYVFRAPRKNGVEDLKKAREYLDQLIEGYEEESK